MVANNNQSIVSRIWLIYILNPEYNRPKTNELPHVPFVHISEVSRQKRMEFLGRDEKFDRNLSKIVTFKPSQIILFRELFIHFLVS